MPNQRTAPTLKVRSRPAGAALVRKYLARNGASRVADICEAVGLSRTTVRTHLLNLESAGLVRSDRPRELRARFTPYFSLAPGPADDQLMEHEECRQTDRRMGTDQQ
ncbi:DNA-binding transcriptional ArsR family regulator [Arthrobacter sp. GAS37]|uniref:helix-turn-helix domain-containing protein n=1 Tax=Arthrobacter sp. GAS37 TaxID=3156261 RepID=UPI003833142B